MKPNHLQKSPRIRRALKEIGMKRRSLPEKARQEACTTATRTVNWNTAKPSPTTEKDQHSEPYLLVVKYIQTDGRKSFPQYHWEEGDKLKTRGDWFRGAPKGPKSGAAAEVGGGKPRGAVFITEGEKDADTLSYDNGLLATTNSEGAGKWTDDLNRWFEGRKTVYVLEDNDAPGRKHAVEVARNLVDIVGEVRIVRFPDVPEGEDVTYWLKELGHTKDQLLERAAAAKLYEKRTRDIDTWWRYARHPQRYRGSHDRGRGADPTPRWEAG